MPRILCVEDNEDNAALLKTWFELECDFEIVVATDGAQGARIAAQDPPDLILMDLSLPVLDGCAATRLIKSNRASCRIPIIALSAHAMAEDRANAFAAGCDDFEAKPVVFARLLAKIRQLLAA